MHISYSCVQYPDIRLQMRYGSKLRGFFAKKYSFEELMHNHGEKGPIYRYPLVQYKVIDGIPTLLGLNEGANLILDIGICEEELNIEGTRFCLERAEITTESTFFGVTDKINEYIFKTPWLALNQENITNYNAVDEIDKDDLLTKILIGNLLSMAKSLNCRVEDKIRVKLNVKPITVNFKGKLMAGFKGGFKSNFCLPDYAGVGKSVSRGYGSIKKQ
ncbi:DNA repair protein [Methanosarcina sp. DH2]|uniref:CRISPR-associated endonuclease Cas6 n=1 Tax=Methanosarcina sp. DH2 TaxID=2605639 RepID=UPI001E2D315C|nr:CRISPR-associated endonuclease Cas6 [Methanosarcina sp. DH2]MCC4769307.1 DNA repair protein [Methanosarcina sp. DH2]